MRCLTDDITDIQMLPANKTYIDRERCACRRGLVRQALLPYANARKMMTTIAEYCFLIFFSFTSQKTDIDHIKCRCFDFGLFGIEQNWLHIDQSWFRLVSSPAWESLVFVYYLVTVDEIKRRVECKNGWILHWISLILQGLG